ARERELTESLVASCITSTNSADRHDQQLSWNALGPKAPDFTRRPWAAILGDKRRSDGGHRGCDEKCDENFHSILQSAASCSLRTEREVRKRRWCLPTIAAGCLVATGNPCRVPVAIFDRGRSCTTASPGWSRRPSPRRSRRRVPRRWL